MVWTFHGVGEREGIHSVHSVVEEGSLEVIGCVTSKTMEDFTALLEMHPLKHMTLGRERESTQY